MKINNLNSLNNFGKSPKSKKASEQTMQNVLASLSQSKTAIIPAGNLMRGISPNNRDVFETFNQIDEVTRKIDFVKSQEDWESCLLEELKEFQVARNEYEENKTTQNFDHMEEEMGDIFYTAASMAKNVGIKPEEAFRSTNRKFFNRINLMERLLKTGSGLGAKNLADCRSYEKRALWNAAKRKIYDAQALQYQASNIPKTEQPTKN